MATPVLAKLILAGFINQVRRSDNVVLQYDREAQQLQPWQW